jgi:hypothetical protein
MKMRILLLAGALLVAATPLQAQSTISPGMTTDQVRAAFGAPATVREAGEWTYWYYHNGCPRRCGSDDVVFLQNGRVVAAVLRTPRRRIAGPAASEALESARSEPATVGEIRVETPGGEPQALGQPDGRATIIRADATGGGNLRVDRGTTILIVDRPQR